MICLAINIERFSHELALQIGIELLPERAILHSDTRRK
jgi:hypothetical protein